MCCCYKIQSRQWVKPNKNGATRESAVGVISKILVFFKTKEFKVKIDKLCSGPQVWSEKFQGARGHHQSPINIDTKESVYDPQLKKLLNITYNENSCSIIKNTGYT